MALAAASFLYLALADLVPMGHQRRRHGGLLRPMALMLAGIATIVVLQHGAS